MLISLCTPVMNRLDDLMATMNDKILAAAISPPVEIVVLDYGSTDGANWYLSRLQNDVQLTEGSFFTFKEYNLRKYYHAAHANNLVMLIGRGEWVVLVPADIYAGIEYVQALRAEIEKGAEWANTDRKLRSTIAIKRNLFVEAGGYDERMEMYGPDDLDLIERLGRRGAQRGSIPQDCLHEIYTVPEKKVANYRLQGKSHKELGRLSMPYLEANRAEGQLVANQGVEWGKWA